MIEKLHSISILTAKPVVRNKFWIVEKDGEKIATIHSTLVGVTLVKDNAREEFASFNLLAKKYKIQIAKATAASKKKVTTVYDYRCDGTPYNQLFDLSMRVPVYTKSPTSRSYFCAGHYLVKIENEFIPMFCPKKITLNRYEFKGPFHTITKAL